MVVVVVVVVLDLKPVETKKSIFFHVSLFHFKIHIAQTVMGYLSQTIPNVWIKGLTVVSWPRVFWGVLMISGLRFEVLGSSDVRAVQHSHSHLTLACLMA